MSNEADINRLQSQINQLVEQQVRLQRAIGALQQELNQLNREGGEPATRPAASAVLSSPTKKSGLPQPEPVPPRPPAWYTRLDWEQFLGENLISKLGILILIIGVGIGARYAIENQLVSPLTRIVLGYLSGLTLSLLALRLKQRYPAYSALLLSGGLAIFYVITYLAYSLYALLPQALAFGLMVLFTGFAVLAALRYNRKLIALFGMVGAYAVPFLLSDGSGRVGVLFTYVLLINGGILVLAYFRQWKVLLYAAFGFSWLIFTAWFSQRYWLADPRPLGLALGFATAYFLLFYAALLVYPLGRKKPVQPDIALLLPANGVIYFLLAYLMLADTAGGESWLGAFSLANGLLHLLVACLVKKRRAGDSTLLYLVLGMVFLFVSLAVPLQLDGYPVTLIWIGEALLLLAIGRRQNISLYEGAARLLVVGAFISLLDDWNAYLSGVPVVANARFLTGLLFSLILAGITYLHFRLKPRAIGQQSRYYQAASTALPLLLVFSLFYTGWLELDYYWQEHYGAVTWNTAPGSQLRELDTVLDLIYCLLFTTALGWVSRYLRQQRQLAGAALALLLVAAAYYLSSGLLALAELRDHYLAEPGAAYFSLAQLLALRYLSMAALGGALFTAWKLVTARQPQLAIPARIYESLLAIVILWLLSSELIHWLSLAGSVNTYRFGLTVLWGAGALVLVALGIARQKVHLRWLAIALFAISLLKVFFYDLARMSTLGRTAVLVALGVLMLLISFLYTKNKYLFTPNPPKHGSDTLPDH